MNSEKELLIYGKRAVYEAIENDVEIDKVFLQKKNRKKSGPEAKTRTFEKFRLYELPAR